MRIAPEIHRVMVSPNRIPLKNPVSKVVGYLVLIAFAVLFLMPLYVMIVTSLKSMDEIRAGAHLCASEEPEPRRPGTSRGTRPPAAS